LATVFQGKYLAGLQQLFQRGQLEFHGELEAWATPAGFAAQVRELTRKPWVVYAKRPFAGPDQVLRYVGRYTHRVALSPRRLLTWDPDAGAVRFDYKDYAHGACHRTLTLTLGEFVRRFALHILPERFTKIRHYGLLANRGRQERLARLQAVLAPAAPTVTTPTPLPTRPTPSAGLGDADAGPRCPYCGACALLLLAVLPRPGRCHPPFDDTS